MLRQFSLDIPRDSLESSDQCRLPLTAVSPGEYPTYPLDLMRFAEDSGTPQTEQTAVTVMAVVPVFALFRFLQRLQGKGSGLVGPTDR